MKNLILVAATILLSNIMTIAQGMNFNEYKKINDPTAYVNPDEKSSYISQVNGDLVFHLWTDYTNAGVENIVSEANRIFSSYGSDISVDVSMFIEDGMFYTGEGEFIKTYNFSDGGIMKVGMMESGIYEEGYGHLKLMELTVRFPQ